MITQWLRRWTWNPMGTSRARSSPARSLRPHFSEIYSEEVGNTNQHLCSQATETDEPKILNYFSWKGHVGDSCLETTTTTILSKKSNNNASKNKSTDGIKFHQNTNNVKRAVMAEWLRRWTWNPMGISRARSSPARSLRSHFSEIYSEEVGNTNQYLCSQATETDEPKILNYFSWKGHVGDSVWKRPPRQPSAKKSKISASNNLSEDGIGFHQNKINVNKAMITQWLRRWTWNPMGTSRARSSPARSLRSHFSEI